MYYHYQIEAPTINRRINCPITYSSTSPDNSNIVDLSVLPEDYGITGEYSVSLNPNLEPGSYDISILGTALSSEISKSIILTVIFEEMCIDMETRGRA